MIQASKTPDDKTAFGGASLNLNYKAMPMLLTEDEVIVLLRIPDICKAADYSNVVKNLKRIHGLPCIHICKKPLYPLEAIRDWILEKVEKERKVF